MYWANFFHIYQPPNWPARIIYKVARESYRPLLRILKRHKNIKITLNISASLTEQLAEHKLHDIIRSIKLLVNRRQIELVGSAMYHPILPLLNDNEIIRQIELNTKTNQKYFGKAYQPRGFFPPEMAYSPKLARLIHQLGFKWIIMDEIAAYGKLQSLNLDQGYTVHGTRIKAVFRNRYISDYFTFHSQVNKPEKFLQQVATGQRSTTAIITAMDGESLGHHHLGYDKYWEKLIIKNDIKTLTISELLKKYKKNTLIKPKKSSWSSRPSEMKNNNPYALWLDPKNTIHSYQWQLLNNIIRLVNKNKKYNNYSIARHLLDKGVASDQFWWASATPWWSYAIIKRKAKELLSIVELVRPGDKKTAGLANKIIDLAKKWQQTKKYLAIRKKYLASQQKSNYIN